MHTNLDPCAYLHMADKWCAITEREGVIILLFCPLQQPVKG
jgi:hypothetical protein